VPIKTEDQLDVQALHRVRERLVSRRTSVINLLDGQSGESDQIGIPRTLLLNQWVRAPDSLVAIIRRPFS
jgi:transposase